MSIWDSRHTPKLILCLRDGYARSRFFADLGAGLTVAVIALPLAMALGIASIPESTAAELAATRRRSSSHVRPGAPAGCRRGHSTVKPFASLSNV